MDPKIQQLLDAGMVIALTKENVALLEGLTQAEIDQLVAIVTPLVAQNATLVFTTFPSIQPPFTSQ